MLPPPRDLHPLPCPHFGEGEFLETLCGYFNNASILLSFHYVGNFPYGCLAVPIWEHACAWVTNDPPTIFFIYLSSYKQHYIKGITRFQQIHRIGRLRLIIMCLRGSSVRSHMGTYAHLRNGASGE